MKVVEGQRLWAPSAAFMARSRMRAYMDWLARERGLAFADYDALWRWSVDEIEAFWQSVWDFFDMRSHTPVQRVLDARAMPGARWFEGATLNYAEQVFRHVDAGAPGRPAIRHASEATGLRDISWAELRDRVAETADALRELGVGRGDRVAAYLPNIPETIVAFLACASVGAIWSVCSPDMGTSAVLDRFRQIAPKLLFAVDGYHYGGKPHDRAAIVGELAGALPGLAHLVVLPVLGGRIDAGAAQAHDWHALTDRKTALRIDPLPFDHPLWIVYSSGTTGMPKPIVHGHGGIVIEQLKMGGLHEDIGPDDVFHWYSSSGWIMWNAQVSGLLAGATIAIYDGNPGYPDLGTLWRFAEQAGVTVFGAGAAFFANCMKAGIEPRRLTDVSRLRTIGSTGSPLSVEAYAWVYQAIDPDVWLMPISGGTDFAGAFVGGCPLLPVHAGEMQCRCLGAHVLAYDEQAQPLTDSVGELVCVAPMPSMPLYFWNDAGNRRYLDSYFDMYPGVWRHGDWIRITPRGGAVIYGRSDATINRHGIRMGTAELYRVVEELPEVLDSLVVDLEYLGRESYMPLFVVVREGHALDTALRDLLCARIRAALSSRHVPNDIFAVPEVPRTLSGKKMEVPVKKLLLGHAPDTVANPDAMANPSSLAWYVDFAKQYLAKQAPGIG